MNRAFRERPSMVDSLRTNVRNGWDRFTGFVNRVRSGEFLEEKKVEIRVIRDLVDEFRDEAAENRRTNPDNRTFMERLRDTARTAAQVLREGIDHVRNSGGRAIRNLRERCADEGVAPALLNTASEALQNLAEVPVRIGASINGAKAVFEVAKAFAAENMLLETERANATYEMDGEELVIGFNAENAEPKLARLSRVRDYAIEKSVLFSNRYQECLERLAAIRNGRERFVAARNATPMPGVAFAM